MRVYTKEALINKLEQLQEEVKVGNGSLASTLQTLNLKLLLNELIAELKTPPKISVWCSIQQEMVTGSKSFDVIKVDEQDDGSYTAHLHPKHWDC